MRLLQKKGGDLMKGQLHKHSPSGRSIARLAVFVLTLLSSVFAFAPMVALADSGADLSITKSALGSDQSASCTGASGDLILANSDACKNTVKFTIQVANA